MKSTTIYLYVKTHNKTGLKYLGKTVKDPYKYKGSGTYWKSHLNIHGNDLTTEVVFETTDPDEFKQFSIEYSKKHNVVESDEWANLRIEDGDGGDTSTTHGYLASLAGRVEKQRLKKWWNNGSEQCHQQEPPDDTYVCGRLFFNNKGAKIGSDKQRGKSWYNNGTEETLVHPNEIPDGFVKGRLIENAFAGGTGRHSAKDSRWWTDGTVEHMAFESPGPDFRLGRLTSSTT